MTPNAKPLNLDVLTIGEPLVEFSAADSTAYRFGYGGDVSNVAVAVSRLGGTSGIATRLGGDFYGEKLRQYLTSEGVSLGAVGTDVDHLTGCYLIHHEDDGHKFSYERKGSAASHWGVIDAETVAIDHVSILHLSGISQAISNASAEGCDALLARASKAGKTVSYDPNYRPTLWSLEEARAGLARVLKHKPIMLPGLDDARVLTGLDKAEDIVHYFLAEGAALVALTDGPDGVYVGQGATISHVPGLPATLVDASGAGDCFDGGFLTRMAAGDDPLQAAEFANRAASISVQRHGAALSIPTLTEVEALAA